MMVDLAEKLRRAEIKSESLLSDAVKLVQQANALTPERRHELPRFLELWGEQEVGTYLDRLRDALKNPMSSLCRRLLEEVGVPAGSVPSEVLEDLDGVTRLSTIMKDCATDTGISALLTGMDGFVLGWLKAGKTGLTSAIASLEGVLAYKQTISQVLALDLPEAVKTAFVEVAFQGSRPDLVSADRLSRKLAILRQYGVTTKYSQRDVKPLQDDCEVLMEAIESAQSKYSMSESSISSLLAKKAMKTAVAELQRKTEAKEKEFAALESEWEQLRSILVTLRQDAGDRPQSLASLQSAVQRLESQCVSTLGSSGKRFVDFFAGEASFPSDLTVTEIEESLTRLRPIIKRALGGIE